MKFDFDVADEKCLAQTGRRSDGQAGSIETVSTSVDHNSFMEINLYLTLEKSLTVKGVDLVNRNNEDGVTKTITLPFDMQYKDSWSQTFTCAKCKLPLDYSFLEFYLSSFSASLERFLPCVRMSSAMRKGKDLQSSNLSKWCRWCSWMRRFFCQGR